MSTTVSPALEELANAVGPDALLTSDEDLREFRDPFAFADLGRLHGLGGGDARDASSSSRRSCGSPTATRCRSGPHGTGRNNGYGGPAPRVKGSVIVSLRRMNRVLEINEECAYAVVEPGVRWFDLYEAIQAGGHR